MVRMACRATPVILRTEPFRMLTELFDAVMTKSLRVAVAVQSGIGKTTAAQEFARAYPRRAAYYGAMKSSKKCLAAKALITSALPPAISLNMNANGKLASIDDACRYLVEIMSEPPSLLLMVDDVHHMHSRVLRALVDDVMRADRYLAIGLVLMGDESLYLPSNAHLAPQRHSMKNLGCAEEDIVLGPTLTSRSFTQEDVLQMAHWCGASETEARNLRDLHAAGRITATFDDLRHHLKASRHARAKQTGPSAIQAPVAPIC